ncbi:hypothetical protein GCM10010365_06350 [Streptomyces poonensis]|uniref:Uncharacterized protein n=1 Tax=Streptomyces poonensis TaxID=68255 RepID=A0A918P9I8_9ACTN|nr:hypothetical protein GCM10010365_06350 [Streptomyces poonensis]GLJ87928.1 hypothetical protein GCM10017589_05280 [Streptomyces poonensis]
MYAASLTKGYGGNPPSGRSVSPPRTGPFFCVRSPCPVSVPNPALPRGPPAVALTLSRAVLPQVPHSPPAPPTLRTRWRYLADSAVGFGPGDRHPEIVQRTRARVTAPVRSATEGLTIT